MTASDPASVRSTQLRGFYAELVVRRSGAEDPRIRDAFARVPRERFAGPGPWSVFGGGSGARGTGYVQTPSDDPAFLYQGSRHKAGAIARFVARTGNAWGEELTEPMSRPSPRSAPAVLLMQLAADAAQHGLAPQT